MSVFRVEGATTVACWTVFFPVGIGNSTPNARKTP